MRPVSSGFLSAAKAPARQPCVKVVIGSLTLYNKDLVSLKVRTEAEKHIGAVEYKTASMEVYKDKVESIIDTAVSADIHIGFIVGGAEEYADLGTFYANSWKVNESRNTVSIELWGKTNTLVSETLPDMPVAENTTIQAFASSLVPEAVFNCLNGNLKYGYLSGKDKREVITDIARSMNALLKYESAPVFTSYASAGAVDILPEASYYSLSGGANGARAYKDVRISVSSPYKTEVKEIARLEDVTPPVGSVAFKQPVQVVQVILKGFSGIEVVSFRLSNQSLSMDVSGNSSGDIYIYGHEYDFTKLSDSAPETQSGVLDYQNPYIQDHALAEAINTSLLTGKQFLLNYTGNPAYETGDTVQLETLSRAVITLHELTFSGGLKGHIEGVLLDG